MGERHAIHFLPSYISVRVAITFQSTTMYWSASKLNGWFTPRIVSWSGTGERLTNLTPTVARIASGAASPNIQEALTLRIKTKKPQDILAFRQTWTTVTADQLVICHTTVSQDYRTPRPDAYASAGRQPRTKNQCIQQIAFESQEFRNGPVVVWTRQGRDEINVASGSTFKKAPPRNLDYHFDLRHLDG